MIFFPKRAFTSLLVAASVLALATSPVLAATHKHRYKHHISHTKTMTMGKTHAKKKHTASPG